MPLPAPDTQTSHDMISIRLDDGRHIVPSDDLKVSAIFYNPAFDKDRGERNYVYPMRIPATPDNNAAMQYLHRVDSNIGIADSVGTLMVDGLPLFDGYIKVGSNNPSGVNVEFVSSGRYLLDSLDKIKLADVVDDIQIDVYGSDLYFFNPIYTDYGTGDDYGPFGYQGDFVGVEIIIDGIPHEYVWTFGVDGDELSSPYDVINFLVALINADYPGLSALFESGGGNPWLQIDGTVIDIDAINPLNMDRVESGFDHAFWELFHHNIVDWIVTVQEDGHPKICFPTIRNPAFYDFKNAAFFGWINYYLSTLDPLYNDSYVFQGNWAHTYCPMYYFKYVMERIRTHVAISGYGGTVWDDPDLDHLIIFNDYALDREIQIPYTIPAPVLYTNVLATLIESRKHLPDITAKTLLISWLTMFNMHYRIRGDAMIFYKNVSQLDGAPIDWTSRCEPIYEQEKQRELGYLMDYQRDPQEAFSVPGQLIAKETGLGDRHIDIPAYTLYMSVPGDDILSADEMLVPTTARPGRSDSFGTSAKAPMLKFLYYRGLQPSESLGDYPMASHGWLNKADTTVGEQSLAIRDNKGLYDKCWRGWVELDTDDIVTVIVRLTYADIRNTLHWDNPKVTIVTDMGQINIIIRELHISASHAGVGLSKVVGVRLK